MLGLSTEALIAIIIGLIVTAGIVISIIQNRSSHNMLKRFLEKDLNGAKERMGDVLRSDLYKFPPQILNKVDEFVERVDDSSSAAAFISNVNFISGSIAAASGMQNKEVSGYIWDTFGKKYWKCPRCKYLNDLNSNICQNCNNPRPPNADTYATP